jgi:hypothetical protein
MPKNKNVQLWKPERFFYSHSSDDSDVTNNVMNALKGNYEVYIAERKFIGTPLIEKLKDEMINCNAIIVSWTEKASKNSSDIISFEVGMAYSLGLPIYLLRFSEASMPWFFDKLTDYISLESKEFKEIKSAFEKIDLVNFFHPIELLIPKEPLYKYSTEKSQSENLSVVNEDGSIKISNNFNGIIHFLLINNRLKPEKNVRLILNFPRQLDIIFDPGSLEQPSIVQRNEIFDMRQTQKGTVRMFWPSLPVEKFCFEIRLNLKDLEKSSNEYIECFVSSDSILGWRRKKFPINLEPK